MLSIEETSEESSSNLTADPRDEMPRRAAGSRDLKRWVSVDWGAPPGTTIRRSLRRRGSFSFLTAGPQWDASLKRRHLEKEDGEAVSLCSFDFKVRRIQLESRMMALVVTFAVTLTLTLVVTLAVTLTLTLVVTLRSAITGQSGSNMPSLSMFSWKH
ncbi:unnamed protein product [Gadus morhua 'NCC']